LAVTGLRRIRDEAGAFFGQVPNFFGVDGSLRQPAIAPQRPWLTRIVLLRM
jgi:hypothetical protein